MFRSLKLSCLITSCLLLILYVFKYDSDAEGLVIFSMILVAVSVCLEVIAFYVGKDTFI